MSKNKSTFKTKSNIGEKVQSQRQLRVAELISVSVVACIRKGKGLDVKLYNSPLTITKVVVSGDLKIANCYFLPFNTTLSKEEILNALEESKYAIRHYVTREINLKYSPELRFFYDQAFENAAKLEKL